jgi:Asp/Glu/hydantoin racemase
MGYERAVGIITLEENIPCPPGTPGNPATFSHPVCYAVVHGTDMLNTNNPAGLQSFIDAGRALVEQRVCAIAGNCGLMIVYQNQLSAALPVPVLLSSLLQLPSIARMYGPNAAIGIIASSSKSLKAEHIRMASPDTDLKTVVTSMEGKKHFTAAMSGKSKELDFEGVKAEVVAVAQELVRQNPDVMAILLECVDLPPYASAIQDAVNLPVFDITTLIANAYSALVRKQFRGPTSFSTPA